MKLAFGLALLNAEKLPSVTTFEPKQPVTEVHEPGTTHEGEGTYAVEVQPLLVIVIEGVEPVGMGLLVKVVPLQVPDTPLAIYVPLPPLAVKITV